MSPIRSHHACLTILACLFLNTSIVDRIEAAEKIDFNRDIRPILSDNCFTCHGPDEQQRVGDLRLDLRDEAFASRDQGRAIVPGDPEASLLLQRVTATAPEMQMPPPDSGRQLTDAQVQLLKAWVQSGAAWSDHWSFVPPVRHTPPQTQLKNWSRNAIDDFVLARLEQQGLRPAVEATRPTLIRRVTLDLTGLPPTPAETAAFLADGSPAAYERVVDRLLASPQYGEHMAVSWLDAARYADTSGYQNDGPRSMWRWRDWVINAFNTNQSFDQFTIEQLAGDLLDRPSLEQRIATGFNRNHRGNAEGGIIPEEYQVEYVVDRVDTTSTVWLGLTMGCARCHDHKYDPLRQKEYYQVFAYFNNIPESGRAIKEGNSPPYIKAPLPADQARLQELDAEIQRVTSRWLGLRPQLAEAQRTWEASQSTVMPRDWAVQNGLLHHFTLDETLSDASGRANGKANVHLPSFIVGPIGKAMRWSGETIVDAGDIANFGYFDKFSIAMWVNAAQPNGTIISRMTPIEEGAGYYVHLQAGRLQVNLIKRWLDDAVRVESRDPLPTHRWFHLAVTYDGSRLASGVRVYVDGQPIEMDVRLDSINQSFAALQEPLRIGGGQSCFQGELDDLRIYGRNLEATEVELLAISQTVTDILALPASSRTAAQLAKLSRYFLANHAPEPIRATDQLLTELRSQRQTLFESLPTVMVMQEMEQPRQTHVLIRGQYDQPGEPVQPAIPVVFPKMPEGAPNNRLGFARWLASPDHPLTARVAVNRYWQRYFGLGLVATSEDFGAQGESPSHPELLDWLATEFVRLQWDIKAMQKLIVTSATYRQSSHVSPELQVADPDNRLLARGPRRRLSAETIRDQALFVCGLLSKRIGGPSVKPYQPPGLWQEIATDTNYDQSHGEDLYRRSLYTYWKRTVAPPTMATFDATSREVCVVQRSRTNTPLQALALLNDPTFVEAARLLAQRTMATSMGSTEERIHHAFLMATERPPSIEELAVLKNRYDLCLHAYQSDPAAAREFMQVGEFKVDESLDLIELAALTSVTSLILNLDEVLNQP